MGIASVGLKPAKVLAVKHQLPHPLAFVWPNTSVFCNGLGGYQGNTKHNGVVVETIPLTQGVTRGASAPYSGQRVLNAAEQNQTPRVCRARKSIIRWPLMLRLQSKTPLGHKQPILPGLQRVALQCNSSSLYFVWHFGVFSSRDECVTNTRHVYVRFPLNVLNTTGCWILFKDHQQL